MSPASRAVVFDLDGVIVSTEEVWDRVREDLSRERGGLWAADAHTTMMGMSTREWTAYMHGELSVPMPPDEIAAEVERRLVARYEAHLPLLPGAADAVRALAAELPLGLASSSTPGLIAAVLRIAGLTDCFRATVSSQEVARGKPAPDVYLRALELLGVAPGDAVAVEDSGAGIRSAAAAGLVVLAIPNPAYPPPDADLALAAAVRPGIAGLSPDGLPG
ncbi:MAG TPA: HAD family phosphatase [Miltoncostaeaceae bacterium]|nr:HAD family phosphatase [Miltoncostaeaceae bacterium]